MLPRSWLWLLLVLGLWSCFNVLYSLVLPKGSMSRLLEYFIAVSSSHKMTTTLIPIPGGAYKRSYLLFFFHERQSSYHAEFENTVQWSIQHTQKLEPSFRSRTVRLKFRTVDVDYGNAGGRAEHPHHKALTA